MVVVETVAVALQASTGHSYKGRAVSQASEDTAEHRRTACRHL